MAKKILLVLFFIALVFSAYSVSVSPVYETRVLLDEDEYGNADADDPAIWVNEDDPEDSLVVCSLKDFGLDVYTLEGELVQHIDAYPAPGPDDEPGAINNVDIIYDVEVGDDDYDALIVGSDGGRDKLVFYTLDGDEDEPLTDVTACNQPWVFSTSQEEVNDGAIAYGLAAYKLGDDDDDPGIAFVTRNDRTDVAKVLFWEKRGKIRYRVLEIISLPNEFTMPDGTIWTPGQDEPETQTAQCEGTVVDVEHGVVYIAQEQVGIWKADLCNTAGTLELVDTVAEYGVPYDLVWDEEEEEYEVIIRWDLDPGFGGEHLYMDVEGLTIYDAGDGEGYLIASSQEESEFIVYDRETNDYIGKFSVDDGNGIDGVQESDGGQVVNFDLGGEFEGGLLVIHDGKNTPEIFDDEGEEIDNSNFKFVRWADIANGLGLKINNVDPDD